MYQTWLPHALSLVEAPAVLLVDDPSTGEHGCEGWPAWNRDISSTAFWKTRGHCAKTQNHAKSSSWARPKTEKYIQLSSLPRHAEPSAPRALHHSLKCSRFRTILTPWLPSNQTIGGEAVTKTCLPWDVVGASVVPHNLVAYLNVRRQDVSVQPIVSHARRATNGGHNGHEPGPSWANRDKMLTPIRHQCVVCSTSIAKEVLTFGTFLLIQNS